MVTPTTLAAERTFLAYERTLMAWIRTSMSAIMLGFSISKYFQYLGSAAELGKVESLIGPHAFGMGMIAIGVAILFLGIWQQRRGLKRLTPSYAQDAVSPATVIAALTAVLGLGAFVLVAANA